MSLLNYLKPVNRLPTLEQAGLPVNVAQQVNQAVEKAMDHAPNADGRAKKRKYSTSFTPEDRATIGRYTAENGNAAAVTKFKASHSVGESTVRSFKKKYLEEVKKRHVPGVEYEQVTRLPGHKRGRKFLLGEELDGKVSKYVEALRSAGTPIGSSVVMAAGEGLVRAYDGTLLVDHGGHITITKSWAMSLLKRMGYMYVKRKATTKSTPGVSGEEFERIRASFLKQVGRMVQLRDIPDSLIINLDQTISIFCTTVTSCSG